MTARIALAFLPLVLAGCSWVPVTDAGSAVTVSDTVPDAACRRLGGVTASTRATLGGSPRSEEKITEELDALARNEAANLGANAVVPTSEIISGRREYDAFLCPEPGA